MKKYLSIIFIFLTLQSLANAEITGKDLLLASDRARGSIQGGVTWETVITTIEDGETSDRSFSVKTRGDDAYVEALTPARTKGEVFLFNNRTMWFFKPSLKKPISISARQKLTGQAANGDIASTNYARDYDATIVGEEKINGEPTKILLLKAKNKQVTYDQIKYWISLKSQVAQKAEFMTLQGTAFKEATFEYKNTVNSGGEKIPFISQMIITDVKFRENKSIIKYSKPKATTIPSALFNVNNLAR